MPEEGNSNETKTSLLREAITIVLLGTIVTVFMACFINPTVRARLPRNWDFAYVLRTEKRNEALLSLIENWKGFGSSGSISLLSILFYDEFVLGNQ